MDDESDDEGDDESDDEGEENAGSRRLSRTDRSDRGNGTGDNRALEGR